MSDAGARFETVGRVFLISRPTKSPYLVPEYLALRTCAPYNQCMENFINPLEEAVICECVTCKECGGEGEFVYADLHIGGNLAFKCTRCQGTGLDKNGCEVHGCEIDA